MDALIVNDPLAKQLSTELSWKTMDYQMARADERVNENKYADSNAERSKKLQAAQPTSQ